MSPTQSVDSSVISIHSSGPSLDSSGPRILEDHAPSPTRSDSSGSILILDPNLHNTSNLAHEDVSPLSSLARSRISSHLSGKQSFDEKQWDSQAGVYMWDQHEISSPSSPALSLTEYLHEMSLRENAGVLRNEAHGQSGSPRMLAKSFRSRSRSKSRYRSGRSSSKRSRSPVQRSKVTSGGFESATGRSASRGFHSSSPEHQKPTSSASKNGPKAKFKPRSRSKSRRRSRSRPNSPSLRENRVKRDYAYTPKNIDDKTVSKDLGAKLLNMITRDEKLYLRILRYEVSRVIG